MTLNIDKLTSSSFNENRVHTVDLEKSYYKGIGSCFGGLSKAVKNNEVDKVKLSKNISDYIHSHLGEINCNWKSDEKTNLITNITKLQTKFAPRSAECSQIFTKALQLLNGRQESPRTAPTRSHSVPLAEKAIKTDHLKRRDSEPKETRGITATKPLSLQPAAPAPKAAHVHTTQVIIPSIVNEQEAIRRKLASVVHPKSMVMTPGVSTTTTKPKIHAPEPGRELHARRATKRVITTTTQETVVVSSRPVSAISSRHE